MQLLLLSARSPSLPPLPPSLHSSFLLPPLPLPLSAPPTNKNAVLLNYFFFFQVLEDVTGEEFVLFMKILSGLKSLQTVSGRQQLVELVAEQADLEQTFSPSDPDCVDRLLQCTRQAVPLFSVSFVPHS